MIHSAIDSNRYRVRFLTPDQKYLIRKYVLAHVFRGASALAYLAAPFLPRAWRTLDRPIFIVGCSRSGTTLFCDMFAKHRDLAHWTEAGQVFELDFYDKDVDHAKAATDVTRFHERRLQVTFGVFTRLRRRKRFLNKHPQNSLRLRFLQRIFPDARFIHLMRDGRAVTLSNHAKTMRDGYRRRIPFGSFPKPPRWRDYMDLPLLERFAHQWVDVVAEVLDTSGDGAFAGQTIEVRYEDFCIDPHGCCRRLDEFCGLSADGRDYDGIDRGFEDLGSRSVSAASGEDLARIAPIIAPMMARLGYPLGPREAEDRPAPADEPGFQLS